jgi:hypothetical protein
MRHYASPKFWEEYRQLPEQVRVLADKNYTLLKQDPRHPSLQFKKIGRFWSVRLGCAIARWRSRMATTWSGSGSAHTPTMTR